MAELIFGNLLSSKRSCSTPNLGWVFVVLYCPTLRTGLLKFNPTRDWDILPAGDYIGINK